MLCRSTDRRYRTRARPPHLVRLHSCAGEAVKDESLGTLRRLDGLANDPYHHVVGDLSLASHADRKKKRWQEN